jgi:raffinose/stachyose/melibiose transport system permease protein
MRKARSQGAGKNLPASVAINLVLGLFSLSCVYPVIWLIYSSLKSTNEFMGNVIGLPREWFFGNYQELITNSDLKFYFVNSIRSTFLSLVFILLFGFIVGYFLSRFRFRGNRLLYALFMAGLLMPIHALIVPMYIQFKQFDLQNKWFTLVLPYVNFGMPIAVFLVDSYLKGIPQELEAAAAIDGASFTRTLFEIILPITAPVLTTIGIIQFFTCWNEFIFALILINDNALFTVPVGVNTMKGQFTTNYTKIMATMALAILPALTVYFMFSKRIIEGMVAGAVKG